MSRRSRNSGTEISLFPFLSILACLIGSLTLIITILSLSQILNQKEDTYVQRAEEMAKLENLEESIQQQIIQQTEQNKELAKAIELRQKIEEREKKIKPVEITPRRQTQRTSKRGRGAQKEASRPDQRTEPTKNKSWRNSPRKNPKARFSKSSPSATRILPQDDSHFRGSPQGRHRDSHCLQTRRDRQRQNHHRSRLQQDRENSSEPMSAESLSFSSVPTPGAPTTRPNATPWLAAPSLQRFPCSARAISTSARSSRSRWPDDPTPTMPVGPSTPYSTP